MTRRSERDGQACALAIRETKGNAPAASGRKRRRDKGIAFPPVRCAWAESPCALFPAANDTLLIAPVDSFFRLPGIGGAAARALDNSPDRALLTNRLLTKGSKKTTGDAHDSQARPARCSAPSGGGRRTYRTAAHRQGAGLSQPHCSHRGRLSAPRRRRRDLAHPRRP